MLVPCLVSWTNYKSATVYSPCHNHQEIDGALSHRDVATMSKVPLFCIGWIPVVSYKSSGVRDLYLALHPTSRGELRLLGTC